MLIRDYGSFGMMGHDTGRDCPVPSGSFPSTEATEAWCDCAYKDPILNASCKLRFKPSDKERIVPLPAPWTAAPLCGAAMRGLPLNNGGVACEIVTAIASEVQSWAMAEGKKLMTTVTGGGSTQPTGGSTQPTGGSTTGTGVTGGTVSRAGPGLVGRYVVPGTGKRGAGVRDDGFDRSRYVIPGTETYISPQVVAAGAGGMGLVLALAAGAYFLPKLMAKRSAPKLAGYSRRRRR